MRPSGGTGGRRGRRLAAAAAAAAGAIFLLAGCEEPPASDVEAAEAALREARLASAGRWAVAEIDHAQSAFDGASREVADQSARFALVRSYGRARTLLGAARADAAGARAAAEKEREEAKAEAVEAVRRARTMLDGARAAILIAPSPRDGRVELDRLRAELHGVEVELPDVDRLIASGEFRLAARKGSELAARLEAAVTRFFGRIERGGVRSSSGDLRASIRACSGLPLALSLDRTDPREEVRS